MSFVAPSSSSGNPLVCTTVGLLTSPVSTDDDLEADLSLLLTNDSQTRVVRCRYRPISCRRCGVEGKVAVARKQRFVDLELVCRPQWSLPRYIDPGRAYCGVRILERRLKLPAGICDLSRRLVEAGRAASASTWGTSRGRGADDEIDARLCPLRSRAGTRADSPCRGYRESLGSRRRVTFGNILRRDHGCGRLRERSR